MDNANAGSEMLARLNMMLGIMVRENASDIYLRSEHKPYLRIDGEIVLLDIPPLSTEDMQTLTRAMLRQNELEAFVKKLESNIMYVAPEHGRFRVNIYVQKGSIAMVMRKIREDISDFETLGLPKKLEQLSLIRAGMILVTGPTGSGKSTTLASMVKYRNTKSVGHIVTIEDPIEFIHEDINCIISQREVGIDTRSFSSALESALRQAPDVLLIGEMRDIESVKAAMYFAETGHLVLGTLHANNASQTIERLLQFFPSEIHSQTLQGLSINLKAVLSQRLLRQKTSDARVPAYELMIVNARIKDLIASEKVAQIGRELDLFHTDGMISFDKCLIDMVKKGQISLETALMASDNPNDLKLKIKSLGIRI